MTTIERIRQYLYEKGLTLKDFQKLQGVLLMYFPRVSGI